MKVTLLRKLRLEHKLSIEKVAADNGISNITLSYIETLQRTPSLKVYRRLQAYYDCYDDLISAVEIPDDTPLPLGTTTLDN